MMAVAMMMITMLGNIMIMITMIDNNYSCSNYHEIYDDKDDNDDNSDKNYDQTMNTQEDF